MKESILGYRVDNVSADQCCEEVLNCISANRKCWLACFNPHSYAVANTDSEFSAALSAADWLVPDGVGTVVASRVLGGSIGGRVTGSDIFDIVMRNIDVVGGMKVFFFGSTEENLENIRIRVAIDYPGVQLVGTYSPPFKDNYSNEDIDEMLAAVNAENPHVLWVGMTAPKQEKWIFNNISRLDVNFVGAVGAVFDFYTGNIKRSHPIFQRLGLEWLPRLLQQPSRLWRRVFVSAPIFMFHVLRAKMNSYY